MARMHDFDWTAHRRTWGRWWARDLERPIVMSQTGSKAEAIEWTKRFLALVKHGTSEVLALHETPAG